MGGVKVDGTTIKGACGRWDALSAYFYGATTAIINGDMGSDQRNNGAAGLNTTTALTGYTIDRWRVFGSIAAKLNWGRNLGSPGAFAPGFPYCLGVSSGSAFSLATSDFFILNQALEADMISDFAWGTVNAQPVTLSFWAIGSVTGTYSGSITNAAATRSYPFSYSLVATVWTKVVVTIPGDTAGTWVMSGNASSVVVGFDLGAGTTFRGPANAWAATNYVGVTGSVNIASTNSAYFYVTGVKLEIGSVATPFNRQSLAKSMADCQRYFQVGQMGFQSYVAGAAGVYASQPYPVQMRASPTIVITANNCLNVGTPSINQLAPPGMGLTLTATSTGAANYTLNVNYTASAEL